MIKSYKLLKDSKVDPTLKAGTTVYDLKGWDYGSANDDTRFYKYPCKAITLNSDGDYPFVVVPWGDLEEIK